MIRERQINALPGLPVLLLLLVSDIAALYGLMTAVQGGDRGAMIAATIGIIVVASFMFAGLFVVNPNEAKVLQLFGDYAGTVRIPGLRWSNPFYTKKRVSQRVRN